MAMEVTRIIHPIGQGAFYSEQIENDGENFTVVYDCGCGTKLPNRARDTIEEWIKDKHRDYIDILFISHFHSDHINGIKILIDYAKVVVMPYINPIIVGELNTLKANLDKSRIDITFDIINPSDYPTTKFVYVTSPKDANLNILQKTNTPQNGNHSKDSSVLQGRIQDIFDESLYHGNVTYLNSGDVAVTDGWYYMPFTRETPDIDNDLLKSTKNLNQYIESLKKNYTAKAIFTSQEIVKDIKKRYKKIDEDLNETSMLLFSSPMSIEKCNKEFDRDSLPSCLYTGDITLTSDIQELINIKLGSYSIGTFQVPHHGSRYSWMFLKYRTINNLNEKTKYFFSYGLHNGHHHPHLVVIDDFKSHNVPVYGVNENITTKIEKKYTI